MRDKIMVFISILVLLGPALYSGGSRETAEISYVPKELIIGYQNIPNGEIIAKDLGWHEKSLGIPVRWVQIDSGRDLNTGIAAGSIDLGLGGSSTTVAGIVQGVPAEVFWIYDIIGDNEALVVRADGDVKATADLKGKTVAAPFGATTHYHLLAALKIAGLDTKDVMIVDMQPPDMLAAWQRGDIDGGFVWEPTLAKMLELGGRVLVRSGELAAKGYITGDIGFVRRAFSEKYPHIVSAYIENQIRAVELFREKPGEAAAAVARQFGISLSEAARQMKSLVLLSGEEQLSPAYMGKRGSPGSLADILKDTSDFIVSQGIIRSTPNIDVFRKAVNPWYLEKALAARKGR